VLGDRSVDLQRTAADFPGNDGPGCTALPPEGEDKEFFRTFVKPCRRGEI
jgi:hypothetical protein